MSKKVVGFLAVGLLAYQAYNNYRGETDSDVAGKRLAVKLAALAAIVYALN